MLKLDEIQNKKQLSVSPILDEYITIDKAGDNEFIAHKQRETYISILSHDMKIPLLAQIRALKLLQEENLGNINQQQKEIINLTLDSCHFMYDLLSTMLSSYRYENREMVLIKEKIRLPKLIEKCFNNISEDLRNKNINIRMKIRDEDAIIYGDKIQIKKAFDNLLDYCLSIAMKNSEIICDINTFDNTAYIYIEFIGFCKTQTPMKEMFKMYTTHSDKMGKVGSTLDLYLAKQIIEAHNGKIKAECKSSTYNSYTIEIPCIKDCKVSA